MRPHWKCMNCVYWDEIENESGVGNGAGQCKRYPPKIINRMLEQPFDCNSTDIFLATAFPITDPFDWCGKYEPANETTEDK